MGAMIALPGGPGNRLTGAEAALALDLQRARARCWDSELEAAMLASKAHATLDRASCTLAAFPPDRWPRHGGAEAVSADWRLTIAYNAALQAATAAHHPDLLSSP